VVNRRCRDRAPDLPVGPSLGLGPGAYGEARAKLPPGAILALYTDGLVRTRTRSCEDGIPGCGTRGRQGILTPSSSTGVMTGAELSMVSAAPMRAAAISPSR
jgi:hypothetical protein